MPLSHRLSRLLSLLAGICALQVCGAPCVSTPGNLASWWRGDSAASADGLIGGNYRGTAASGAGYLGPALVLDGRSDAIRLPPEFKLTSQNFSVEAWVRRANDSLASRDVEAGEFFANGNQGFAFGLTHDGRLYLSHIGVVSFYSTTALRDTNWNHVAVSREGGTLNFYLNGMLANSLACGVNFNLDAPYAVGGLGTPVDGAFYGFWGSIDELGAYNRALSGSEIAAIHQAGAAGKCPTGPGNLIVNGGFETPAYSAADGLLPNTAFVRTRNLPGWEVAPGDGAIDIELQQFGGASSFAGNQCLDLEGAENLGAYYIRQTVSTVPGKSYRLRFAYAKNPAQLQSRMKLELTGANVGTQDFELAKVNSRITPGWQPGSVEFVAEANSVQVQFTGTSPAPGFGMLLDEVTLTEIQKVPLSNATATYSQVAVQTFPAFPVGQTIDGIVIEQHNGWAIYPRSGAPETAVWETLTDLGYAGGCELSFKIQSLGYLGRHGLGRFRLSATSDPRSEFADGLSADGDVSANWTILATLRATTSGTTILTPQEDGSLLASGEQPYSETYFIDANCPLPVITGIRLEALPDPSLPKNGPGRDSEGNFIISEFEVSAAPLSPWIQGDTCTAPPANLAAWLRGEGDASDWTFAHPGTFAAPKFALGKVGQAFDFDGSNEVVLGDSADFNRDTFTLEAWVYPTSLDGAVDMIANKEAGTDFSQFQFEIGLKGPVNEVTSQIPLGNVAFYLAGVTGLPDEYGGWVDGKGGAPLNQWTHVALAVEPGAVTVFVNGVATRRLTGLGGTLQRTTGPLKLGSRHDNFAVPRPAERFNGRIDEFSFYTRRLADTEISAIHAAGEMGKCYRDATPGDLEVVLEAPAKVALDQDFVVTARLINHGIAPATQVTLTNTVPLGVSVGGVTNSQGSSVNLAGFVISTLGTIGGGQTASVQITCRPLLGGHYTVSGALGRAEIDPVPANDRQELNLEALPLTLALGPDPTARENDGVVRVQLVLSAAAAGAVEATYRLVDGTAKSGVDFLGTNGVVRFAPGVTEAFVEIPLINDRFFEATETFSVELATSAPITLGRTNGIVSIENDDPKPTMAVSDVVILEGNSGGTNAVFTVSLTGASEAVVTVDYATVSGTASAPTDYLNATGTLTFTAGELAKTVEVRVNGDTAVEANESFQLVLSNVANADLADANGAAAILNDDFVAGQLAGFRWDAIAGNPKVGENIPARLTAVDGGGAAVAGFNGTVLLQATATGRAPASVVISEVDAASSSLSRLEFGNVGTNPVDLSAWTITLYDSTTWPLPTGTVTLNSGNTLQPAGIFQLIEGAGVNQFPSLRTGFPLVWGAGAQGRHLAVLLRDATGNIVDFFCAMRALPDQIQVPVSIPPEEWNGLPMVEATAPLTTYQRAGNADSNSARDWATQSSTPNRFATIMTVPFADSRPLAMTPEFAAEFQNGVWTGNVQLQSFVPQVALVADDGNGHLGRSEPFSMSAADDLAVTLTVDPNQTQHPGSFVHYRAEVTQCCATISSNVVVEVRLPAYFGSSRSQIAAVTVSQGTHELGTYLPTGATQGALLVRASLGQLGLGQSAQLEFDISRQNSAQLTLMPTNATATATVTRTQPEQNLANNSAEAVAELNAGCTTLPEGALAWWRGEMNLNDSLGLAGTLELVGTSSDFLAYAPGRTVNTSALNLDRSRSFQTTTGFQWKLGANQDFSAELWLRVVSGVRRDRIMLLDKRAPATGVGFALFLDQGRLGVVLTDTEGTTQSLFTRTPAINVADLRDGRWHHVALSARRDPQVRALLLAVDGGVTTLSSLLEVTGDLGNAPLRLGFEPGNGMLTALVGLLDEVTVYSTALNAGQLTTLSRSGGAGKCLADVRLSFTEPKPVAGQFPNPISVGRPLPVTLTITNAGPLALPTNWVAVDFSEGGQIRHLTPRFGTNVFSPYTTYYDFGPLAAGAGRLIEVEVTLTNIPTRLRTELAAWQLFVGQNYRFTSDVATFRINPDGDADGAADVWELTNGFDPLNAADATADTDGDGFLNVDEFQLGTDPRSATDVLKLELSAADANGVRFRFPGKAGKSYGLFRRAQFGDPWSEISRFTATENAVVELADTTPPADAAFYQIQLLPTP